MTAPSSALQKIAVAEAASPQKLPIAPSGRIKVPSIPAEATIKPEERDSYTVTALGDVIDRSLHAGVARLRGQPR